MQQTSTILLITSGTSRNSGDGAGNTVEENYNIFSLIQMRQLPSVL